MTTLGNGSSARTPSGMRVAPQSYASLEQAANTLRPLLPVESGADGKHRISGWRVLEHTLQKAGYSYHVAPVEELDECAAFTIPDDRLVVVRRDVYDGLFTGSVFSRSTVIHELAHIVLKHHVTLHRGATLGAHGFHQDSEWQAKAMTAAVMMPIAVCQRAYGPAEVAEICGTSQEAAGYRLNRLAKEGLISRQPSLDFGDR